MAEIGFYHLTTTGPDRALPVLLGRTLAAGQRAVLRCGSEERVDALDAALWLGSEPDWLPHGTARTGQGDLQPIWITTEDNAPNGARFLFLLDGMTSAHLDRYERVFDLFGAADIDAARSRWAAAKAAGHTLTYWQQTERGWVKKA